MNIDINITACNEYEDLYSLLIYLQKFLKNKDKIHLIIDSLQWNIQNELANHIIKTTKWNSCVIPHYYEFDTFEKNFAFSKQFWENDIVLGLCADEFPSPFLMFNLTLPFIQNTEIDMVAIPRMNIYTDLTVEKSNNMYVGNRDKNFLLQEPINELGWHCWPDYQMRLFRNIPNITYSSITHQSLIGYKKLCKFPASPEFAILHAKTVDHQEKILRLYDKLEQ